MMNEPQRRLIRFRSSPLVPLADRIEEGSVFDPETGCRLWCGKPTRRGYCQIRIGSTMKLVHRLAWELVNGPIPDGLVIDHKCRDKRCCRVDHLRVVTQRQNVLENSNSTPAINAQKRCCPRCGGEYTKESSGYRRCKPCQSVQLRLAAEAAKKEDSK